MPRTSYRTAACCKSSTARVLPPSAALHSCTCASTKLAHRTCAPICSSSTTALSAAFRRAHRLEQVFLDQIEDGDPPFLLDNLKSDIRLYVLVTSFSPLTVWIHRGGFARFSHSRYSAEPSDIANMFMHLTNVAVQKTAENYDAKSGMKWAIQGLKLYLVSKHGAAAVDALLHQHRDRLRVAVLSSNNQWREATTLFWESR